MQAYEVVKKTREANRLTSKGFINYIIRDFVELHGDRKYGDDSALIGGIGYIKNMPVTVLGIEKGTTTKERIKHNFGSVSPEGYRKALRLMKQAQKFKRPVLCFVDTAGAYCGVDAEKRGQGQAIAENLFEMSTLEVPILSIVIGEGGSGGALALSHSDNIWMLEDSYYSVVSPENCANIIWKDVNKASFAAESLGLCADNLYSLGVIDRILPAIDSSNEKLKLKGLNRLSSEIYEFFTDISSLDKGELVCRRYKKYRKIGY